MRECEEMVTASRMQNMVQIHKKNVYFVTRKCFLLFLLFLLLLGLSASRAPSEGPYCFGGKGGEAAERYRIGGRCEGREGGTHTPSQLSVALFWGWIGGGTERRLGGGGCDGSP